MLFYFAFRQRTSKEVCKDFFGITRKVGHVARQCHDLDTFLRHPICESETSLSVTPLSDEGWLPHSNRATQAYSFVVFATQGIGRRNVVF